MCKKSFKHPRLTRENSQVAGEFDDLFADEFAQRSRARTAWIPCRGNEGVGGPKKRGQNLQFWVIYLDWLISYGFGIDFWCFLIWVLLILIILQWHILPYPSCKIPEYSYDNPRWSQRESESSGVFLGLISDDFRWIRLILN